MNCWSKNDGQTMWKDRYKISKSFRPIRFNGDYKNYVAILEKELGMKFDPYFRSEEQRQIYREKYTGTVGPNAGTKVIIDSEGKRKHVKNWTFRLYRRRLWYYCR